jgi:hypothetical protein
MPEHIFIPSLSHFHVFILTKHAFAVSHFTVTLQMMRNSRRSEPVTIAHLPKDQAVRKLCYDCKKFGKNAEIILQVTSCSSSSSEELHTYSRMNRTSIALIEENDLLLLLVYCEVTVK